MMSSNLSTASAKLPKNVSFVKTYGGIKEYKLKNGLRILLLQDLKSPLISWQVWYKVGSRNEESGYTGLAHYLEHMMFKGTKTFEKGEISQAIQLKGGIFNAFTSDDYTAYYENFSPEHLELGIKLEADRMRNSRLDEEELNTERSVIVSELEGGENNPQSILYKSLKATAYQTHPYKNPIIGWRNDLDNINAKKMREFYDTYYQPNNATAVLAGNFDEELALDLIEKYFGDFKAIKDNNGKHSINGDAISKEAEQKGKRETTLNKDGLVKLLGMSFHIPEFKDPDYPVLTVIADILFGGTGSRIYKKVIDPGLAIDVSGYAEAGIDPSVFRLIANLKPEDDINEIEKTIDKELEAIKSGVSEEELKKAKARVEAAAIYERDGIYNQALQLGYFAVLGNWEYYIDWVDTISKISNEDIKRVAKKYFKETNKTTAKLLPGKAKEKLAKGESNKAVEDLKINSIIPSPFNSLNASYGAAKVEPLDPKKLKRLLKLTEPKYSKSKIDKFKIDLNLQNIKLKNGIELIFKEDHSLPLVFLNGVFYAGAVSEPKPKLATLTAEMLERGTLKHDKFEFSDMLDLYGAEISFSSKKETAEFEISTLRKYLDDTLALFKENLYEPEFSEEELNKLKEEQIALVEQEDEYLSNIIARELNRIIYSEGHPYYARTPEEKKESLESITIKDIKDYYKEKYTANGLKISVVGDITLEEINEKIIPILEKWNNDPNNDPSSIKIPLAKLKDATEKNFIKNNKKQSEVLLGHSGAVSRLDKDFYPLLLANFALGGSPLSSRLGSVVRDENGLVYDIRSAFHAGLGAGSYSVSLGCNPQNVKKAIKLTKDAVKDFLKEGVNETELDATKSYITGSFSARNLSSNEDLSQTLSYILVYRLGDGYIENYSDLINNISLEEVNAAARKHIKPDNFSTVIAGPEAK